MKNIVLIFLMLINYVMGQENCNALLLSEKDSLKYKACKKMNNNRGKYYQFDWRQIELYEEVLKIDSTYADAYREIAAPYIKAGNFLEWKKYIDKAVKFNPEQYLYVRASNRYKFFADYLGTIKDIEEMEKNNYLIDYTSNGMYHLMIVKGLCFKELGEIEKAIETIEKQLNKEDHFLGSYDYIHLGVLYLENKQYKNAISALKKQEEENDIAENRFYIAKAYCAIGNKKACEENLIKSKELYKSNFKMHDSYNELIDQIYLSDIDEELSR